MKKEIKIAGGGLSGLVAGVNLLKADYDVTIFEKRQRIGGRFTNDFQSISNWLGDDDLKSFLERMNLKLNFLLEARKEIVLWGPNFDKKVNLNFKKPAFYLVKRGVEEECIDTALKEQFIAEGGKIKFNESTSFKEKDIIATGPKRADIISYGYNFKTDFKDINCIAIDNDLAPKAYTYLTVRNNKGSTATVLTQQFADKDKYLKKTIKSFEQNLGIGMKEKEKFQGYASFPLLEENKERVIRTGEVGGFQDALTGFGMFFAIKTGYLAAKSIIKKVNYNKLCRDELDSFIKASVVNRFLYEIGNNKGYELIISSIQNNDERTLEILKKEYNYNWIRKILYPVAYLFMQNKT